LLRSDPLRPAAQHVGGRGNGKYRHADRHHHLWSRARHAPASARIAVEGTLLSTHTDSVGSFKLEGVPALQLLTVDAQRDALASAIASRPNVAVQPGETLDLGTLDVGACPAPPAVTPIVNQDETLVSAPDTSNDYYSER
jgi:hypothetical protein